MNTHVVAKLKVRNDALIRAVLKKCQDHCPDAVDLIGIAGSFCHKDFNEKSDLDLLIICTDEKAQILNSCFILEDVAHDIYCSNWNRLEEMSAYNTPHISKLFDLEIVYTRNQDVYEKYLNLRKIASNNLLDKPTNKQKAQKHLEIALTACGKMMIANTPTARLTSVSEMIVNIEYSLYFLNSTYIKKGIKRIPEEIAKMELLPPGFVDQYHKLFIVDSFDDLSKALILLLRLTDTYLHEEYWVNTKKKPSVKDLTGTYEEIYSNWNNKVLYAAGHNDPYLAFMTIASCQKFYTDMANEYDIPHISIIDKFDAHDLVKTAKEFNKGMTEWKKLYHQFSVPMKKYTDIDEFNKDYLES